MLSVPAAIAQPQVRHREFLTKLDIDLAGRDSIEVARGGFLVDGVSPLPKRAPPRLGEHTDELLQALRKATPA